MEIRPIVIVATLCAYAVKGMCGFANTLVFTSILSFRGDSVHITPVELLIGIPSNILLAVRERKAIRLQAWLPLAIMVIVGGIPGIFLLKFGSGRVLKLILGLAITGIGLEMLLREHKQKKKSSSPLLLFIIGILSGFLSGLFGIGALLAAYMGRTTETTDAFRGNLCMVFLVDNLFRLVTYIATGILTWRTVKTALLLIPFMLLGLWGGIHLSARTEEKRMRKLVTIVLVLSGVSLFLTQLI